MVLWRFFPLIWLLGKGASEEWACGSSYLAPRGAYRYKSIGGYSVGYYEFPWLIYVRITYENSRFGSRSTGTCTGVLISPRHVITAAHCLLTRASLSKACSTKGKLYQVQPRDVKAYLTRPMKEFTVTECSISSEFDGCNNNGDIGILRIEPDVSPQDAIPICLPSKNQTMDKFLLLAGYGLSGTSTYDYGRDTKQINKMLFKDVQVGENGLLIYNTKTSERKKTCKGDSGAPLFQMDSHNRYVLMGVHSGADPTCEEVLDRKKHKELLEKMPLLLHTGNDIRSRLDWIYNVTGIEKPK
ncbi:hypothetical protein Q1695_010519 [Nippostrongylus brasiliensis]|nr:hypothetical protein Q1695_010519 [Nippostrongylus brasiliensis]